MKNSDFKWLTEDSLTFLGRDYLLPGQEFTDRIKIMQDTFAKHAKSKEIVDKWLEYTKRGWYSFSTPVWTNYGTKRGLPISCFGSYIADSMESILYAHAETGMMSKLGGGTSAFFDLRPRGASIKDNGESAGPYGFLEMFDIESTIVSQGKTRRGSFAAYMSAEHADIMEFLDIKSDGNRIQDLNIGVCVSDEFMQKMIDGDARSRKVWAKILEVRRNIGVPYIIWTGNANKNKPEVYIDNNMEIWASNLCTEIMLPANEYESFICCLSSMNLLYYDEWKDTDAVEVLTYFLDSVIEEFIINIKMRVKEAALLEMPYPTFMERALRFAERHRAIGLGVLGWHSYLKSKMIAFDDFEAKMLNVQIFKLLQTKTLAASKQLAEWFGEPELLKGYGRRNTTLMTIPPSKSTAFIMQVTENCEPDKSNFYMKDLAKIKFVYKCPFLKKLLAEKYDMDNDTTWDSIKMKAGSVQHLDFLSDQEREVFKIAAEIATKEIIIQAAQRQHYIDQGQSINIMIYPTTTTREINALYIEAWRLGIKSLYYQYSVNAAQEFARSILDCKACE